MAIDVRLSSTWDAKGVNQAVKDINAIKSQLGSIERRTKVASDSFNAFGGTLKSLGTTVAAVFSAREIGQFFSASIKGAIEDEKSLRVLNKTLSNLGFAGATQQVDDFISRLQFSAGIADDQLRPALNNLVLATGNLSKSQELLQVALDVSAGSGRDLDTITVALAKAYNGNYTALKKLNLGIDESLIKNKDLSGILTVLSQKFAGASANAVDTYAGRIQILKLAVGEAQESIGYGLLDALTNVSNAIGTNTSGLAGQTADLGDYFADVARGAGVLTANLITLGKESENTGTIWDDVLLNVIKISYYPFIKAGEAIAFLTGKLNQLGKAERLSNAPDAGSMRAGSRLARLAKENQSALENQTQASEKAKKAQEELKKNTESLIEVNKNYAKFVAGTSPQSIEGATLLAQNALVSIQKLMSGSPRINAGLVTSFKELASVVQNNFSIALDQARTKLNQAKQQYDNFKSSIKGSITSIVNFGNKTEGLSFVANLQQQAEQAKNFSGQIAKLMQMGLNQSALQQLAQSGYEVGSVIAQEIIDGGSTVVNMVNQLVSSVDAVAEQVSTNMAQQFYGAGVDAAQNLVDGLIQRLNESAALIAQAIANATAGQVTTNIPPKKGKPPKKNPPPPQKRFDFGFRASGGPVMGGRPYIVGERGPELFMPSTGGSIIPNSRTKSNANINITVNAGMGTNGALVGKQIVEAIKKYEKTSGQVFAGA